MAGRRQGCQGARLADHRLYGAVSVSILGDNRGHHLTGQQPSKVSDRGFKQRNLGVSFVKVNPGDVVHDLARNLPLPHHQSCAEGIDCTCTPSIPVATPRRSNISILLT